MPLNLGHDGITWKVTVMWKLKATGTSAPKSETQEFHSLGQRVARFLYWSRPKEWQDFYIG